ncbi:bifunctional phosphopantothenoylcysteine decarboxylase/phosphopantothenate--cysteine ligase CoaBC [Neomegalonema perideroedes]|uniref:bifunctional phosphopantothenoylcysteine decarboxylase/phosphopantothenate--cysteine ligase CoaBC n=1 Tax=Neomegalonema perideroedes TaxID=217219 RepID=UPI0003813740|nr:bifunctional phosphopantothenoylcysteine decarboxylase/phosphopantothenate--cysteine ligase CoaBC [Neomegalonema perideroedes]
MIYGKRILLIVGGGVAAFKAIETLRLLRERGAEIRCVLTKAGGEFVTPLSLGALSGSKVHQDLFDLTAEAEMGHIQLSRWSDLVLVVPATADFMAKMAQGRADDLASTLVLATDKPVMIAPAMNVRMWEHPATRRNLEILRRDNVKVVGPNAGEMACGEYGYGRLSEPEEIAKAVVGHFLRRSRAQRLKGMRIVVTSGPTRESIDPVRYISNHSSGKQGVAVAEALARRGAEVIFVTGPAEFDSPEGCHVERVTTAEEMLRAVMDALPAEAMVAAAAVADWRMERPGENKMKKDGQGGAQMLRLVENPDILARVSALGPPLRPKLVVGFAAETTDVVNYARAKRARKGCDWIVANDVSPATGIMGGDENAVVLVTAEDEEPWPRLSKREVGDRLAERMTSALIGAARAEAAAALEKDGFA